MPDSLSSKNKHNHHYLESELLNQLQLNSDLIWFVENGSLDGLWYRDLENPEHEWLSPRFKSLFGYSEDEIPHTSSWWQENIHPDDLPRSQAAYEAVKNDPSRLFDEEVRYRHKDGRTIWVRCRGMIICNDTGEPIRMIGSHTDITSLKSREAQLDYLNGIHTTILDTVQHGLMMFEAQRNADSDIVDLEMVEANASACQLVGRPRDAIVGKRLSETFPGNFEDGLFDAYRKALETGKTARITKHYRHENLDNWYDIVATPHSVDLIVISFNDITNFKLAERELELERRRFQELYFRTPAIMHSIDASGRILQVSDAWCKAFGYARHEIEGKLSTSLLTEESKAYAKDVVLPAFWRDGRCERAPYIFQRKDGSTFEGELSAVAFDPAGGASGSKHSFAVIEEVTERNQSRRDLEANIEVLNETKSRLESFSYAASHDLQEPLRKIETFLPMALEAMQSGDRETADYAKAAMHRAVSRAKNLITALLSYAKSQNRPLELKNVVLEHAVKEAWAAVLPHDGSAEPRLQLALGETSVQADTLLLEVLLSNLFSNALKYQEGGAVPVVSVWLEHGGDDILILHVKDNGIGFQAENEDLIFEPFKRLHTHQEYPGSGIGLATCSTICRRLDWTISARGAPGAGATFSISLGTGDRTP